MKLKHKCKEIIQAEGSYLSQVQATKSNTSK